MGNDLVPTKANPVQTKSFEFAVKIVGLCQGLRKTSDFVISHQLLKSGTSIGANVEEALAGQSRKDFAAKMAIASKEARESCYWIRLLQATKTTREDYLGYLANAEELVRILTAIVKSSGKKP